MAGQIPKCSKDDWCVAMAARLDPEVNAHRKGLTRLVVYSVRTGRERVIGVAFKTKPSDRGIMLNVCPWCEEPILWLLRDEPEVSTS